MSKNNKGRKKKRSILSTIITMICLSVFVYAAYGLFDIWYDYYTNDKVLANLQDIYYEELDEDGEIYPFTEKRIRPGFDRLKEMNEEIVGWITIDDTKIDYPILQSGNNTDYLNRNYYGEQSVAGSIFMDFRNDITMRENNMILYGHRMKNGAMFQQLEKYLDEDFFYSNRTFIIDTLYDSYEAEVFAVYNTMIDFNYIETDFSSDEEFNQLLAGIRERSIYDTDIELTKDNQMITLSTCEYTLDPDDSRLVVHAKLTKIEG